MERTIRKVTTQVETVFIEGGKEVETPWTIATAAAVIHDPYTNEYKEDLSILTETYSTYLSELFLKEIKQATGWDLAETEGIGKGVGVGLNVEIEHGCAVTHHRKFGDPIRNTTQGSEGLVSTELRIAPGDSITVPLKHKNDHTIRSHHMSATISIPDAPRENEIIVALSIANTGRPFARIGSPQTDIV